MARLLLLAALAATVAACGDNNDDEAGAVATTAPATTAVPADQKWKKVVPGGDCECADGSEFAFWERRGDPARVVFFLDGGGACYDAATSGSRSPRSHSPGFERPTAAPRRACCGRHAIVQTRAEPAPASAAEQACRHLRYVSELPS